MVEPDLTVELIFNLVDNAYFSGFKPGFVDAYQAVLALDSEAFAADRAPLLRLLVADGVGGPLVARSDSGIPEGYALARRGRLATYIGPMVGTTASASEKLLDGMLARFAGEEVLLDLHRMGRLDPSVLAERGLSKRRSLTRMRLGDAAGAGTARSLCASAGPELG